MTALSVLYISDPYLGARGLKLVARYFPTVISIIWQRGDKPGRRTAREVIRRHKWDLVISFYSDLILKPEDLEQMRLPINIHPALPSLPGVGFDTLPLIENHRFFGATLHRVTPQIDDGEILDVCEEPLWPRTGYMEFRKQIHRTSLRMLSSTLEQVANCGSVEQIETRFETMRAALLARGSYATTWSRNYCSYSDVVARLNQLWKTDPQHRVFQQNSDFRPTAENTPDALLHSE